MFQSPEGDSLFFYEVRIMSDPDIAAAFQSPEGDSLFFYLIRSCARPMYRHSLSFSPPKGIHCFSTGE